MEDYLHPIFRWLHIFAGVMWIGLLYFFNFVNAPFAGTIDGDTKKKVVPELMPRALYWFRMGAAWTWFTGLILLYLVFWSGSLAMGSGDNMMSDGVVNVWTHVMITFTFLSVFFFQKVIL